MKTNNVISQITFKAIGFLLTWCLLSFAPEASGQGYSLSTFTDKVWCVSSYNSDTITVSFSIDETAATGFDDLQTDQDIYIELPSNFEFVPGQGTVTYASGLDIGTIDAFSITAGTAGPNTRIDVQLDVPTETACCDTLYFNDFQIFATAVGSGAVTRNGGTLTVDAATTNPTGAEVFGNLTAITPMSYTSSTVTQTNTASLTQFGAYNEIIGIEVVVADSCNPFDVTQFDLSTLGTPGSTDPANDIGEARIYYTGTSGTYAKTTLFGTLGSSPSGAFSITGTQTLVKGTNYFWLTYDIKKAATVGNDVDASVDSILIDGAWKSDMTVSDPAGKRSITALTTAYSVTEFVFPAPCGPFPSAYVTDSFSINEVVANGFAKNQTTAKMVLTLPAGFEFNPGGSHTISSAAGGDITAVTITSLTTSALTIRVTIPDTDGDDDLDTIFLNDLQIRATAAVASDSLVRMSGAFVVYDVTTEPTISFADLGSADSMSYASSTVTQSNTTTLTQFSTYNEIIGIEVVVADSCNPFDVTQFDLSTLGTPGSTDPANDIGEARIYYTGTSGTYAKTTLFGTLGSSPSGAFSITGTQTLVKGTNYFWLTYDIKKAATVGNDVDASVDSILIDGAWRSDMTVSDPAGKRSITALTIAYSVTEFVSSIMCASATPTYTAGSFAINEVVANGFGKNQTSATIVLTLPAGFEFNTGVGTVSPAAGGDITSVSVVSLTTTVLTIDVTIPDTDGDDDLDTIYFNDFQIRSTSVVAADSLIKTGGTFVIYEVTTEPTISFADLSSVAAMSYTSSTVTQTNTEKITQSSTNNQILGIEVVTAGSCNPISATQFYFNTDGNNGTGSDNPATNITNAKVFYTGTTGTFSTATQFGSTLVGPNGAFTITGSQALSAGTNYFWLSYDIPSGAVETENLDARCDSIVINSGVGTQTPSTVNPVGKRTIVYTFFSRASGDWDDVTTWSLNSCGGVAASDYPQVGDIAIICSGHSITNNNVIVVEVDSLYIQSNADYNSNASNMILTGNAKIDGSLNLVGGILQWQTAGTFIDGIGTFCNSGNPGTIQVEDGNKTIRSGADLTIYGDINFQGNAYTIANKGEVTVTGDIVGGDANSTWTQDANSTLNAGKGVLISGTLNAITSGNTVNYDGVANQTIKDPSSSTYYNLSVGGTSSKSLAASVTIDGDLNIASGTFDIANNSYDVTIKGNWTNDGDFSEMMGSVTFSGTAQDQTIGGSAAEIFYDLTINKSGKKITLNANVNTSNTLTMTAGDVSTGSYKMILGVSTADYGTLSWTSGTIIGKFERYFQNGTNPVAPVLFPVGTASDNRPANLDFISLASNGSVICEFVETDPTKTGLPLVEGGLTIRNTFVEGYWDMTAANGLASSDYDLNLEGNGFTSWTLTPATRLLTRSSSGSSWTLDGAHVAATGDTALRSSITTLSAQYCFGDTTDCTAPSAPTVFGSQNECTNSASVLYYTSPPSGSNYITWTITGGTVASDDGNNKDSVYVTWGATGMVGTVRAVEFDPSCSNSSPTDYAVNVHSIGSSSISGSADVGENQTGVTYSVTNQSGYGYNWTITGGSITSGQGTNSILVDWAAAGSGTVQVKNAYGACDSATTTKNVTIYSIIKSVKDGFWNVTDTWDCGCVPTPSTHVQIQSGDTVQLNGVVTEEVVTLIIDANGMLDDNGGNTFTVTGNFTLNGRYKQNGGALFLTGTGTDISGSGAILDGNGGGPYSLTIQNGGKTILIGSNLTVNGNFNHDAAFTVTNKGTITITDDILGSGTWLNDVNSTLNIGGSIAPALSASASGNTVNYDGAANQTIILPSTSQYYHLQATGGNTKTLAGSIDVDGDLTISSTLDVQNGTRDITVGGNWINTGTFIERTGLVTFDGTAAAAITNLIGETFYDLTINKSGSTISLNDNVTASESLTMTAGNIDAGTNTLTLGTGTGNVGTLTHTLGTIIGKFERWKASNTTTMLYPVGTATYYRPANVTFAVAPTAGSLIGEFVETAAGNNGLPISNASLTPDSVRNAYTEGYWTLTDANGFASSNYGLDLEGEGFTSFTLNSSTRILKRAATASPWTLEGTHGAATGDTAHRTVFTSFPGEYCFGDTINCIGPSTGAISGADSVCINDGPNWYTVSSAGDVTNWDWTITGGSIFGAENNDSIQVIWGGTGMAGTVQVKEKDDCSWGATVTKSVNIHPLPTSAITGDEDVTENTTGESYSVTSRTGYTYTWTITGGTLALGQGTNSITVDWGAEGVGNVRVVGSCGCGSASEVNLVVNKYISYISNGTGGGDWNVATSWLCNCVPNSYESAIIDSGDVVALTAAETIKHIIIYATSTLDNAGNIITVDGNYTIDGTHSGTGNIQLDGGGATIDGAGTITNTGVLDIRNGSKTISSTASITKSSGDFNLGNSLVVSNNGSITIGGDIVGGDASSTWINVANSTLNIGGAMLSTGVLTASAIGNTVNYNGAGAQTVKSPSSTYYNLTSDVSGTKTIGGASTLNVVNDFTVSSAAVAELAGALDVDNDIIISGTAALDVSSSNYAISLAGDWENSSTIGDPFVQQSGAVTFDGTSTQYVNTTSLLNERFYNLTINKGGGTIIPGASVAIFLTNSMTFTTGIVDAATNGATIVFDDNATSNGGDADSYVDGKVQKTGNDAFVFPIGDGIVWARLGISNPTSATTQYTAQYFYGGYAGDTSTDATIAYISEEEYWTLDQAVNDDDVSVTLYWEDANRSQINYFDTDLVVAHYNSGGGGDWEDVGHSAISGGASGSVTSNLVTDYSPFTFASKSGNKGKNPLPIELLAFDVEQIEDVVRVTWTTASEINNDFFTVERSEDGLDFEFLTYIQGAGTSNFIRDYSYIDVNPLYGTSYYRLKQTDFDGQSKTFPMVAVEYQPEAEIEIAIYPNPTQGKFFVDINGYEGEEVLVVVLDMMGREHFSKVVVLDFDGYTIAFDPSQKLASGVYMVVGSSNDKLYSKKLVIR